MNPNQDNQYGGGVPQPQPQPQPQPDTPQPNPYAQQPVTQQQAPVQYSASPSGSSGAPLGLISIGLAAAAVISLPLLAVYVTSTWILLIPLIAGAAAVALAIIASKGSSLTWLVVLSIALGASVSVLSFTQMTQSLVSQQKFKAQMEDLKVDLPSASGGSGSTYDDIDDALERSRQQVESMRRMNEQLGN